MKQNIVSFIGWQWRKIYTPPEIMRKPGNLATICNLKIIDAGPLKDVTKYPRHDLVFITGDGSCLVDDVQEFESWGLPHDLYCVNRSMLFFERQVDHWAAIDIEESAWFAENVNAKIESDRKIVRHTIGSGSLAYDVYWEMELDGTNDLQRRIMVGNTGYFAILTAIKMGYKKIVIGAMPLDMNRCWYEPEDADGPNWMGWCYVQWMDFKMKHPEAERVRSLSGYSKFILGPATKDWAMNGVNT